MMTKTTHIFRTVAMLFATWINTAVGGSLCSRHTHAAGPRLVTYARTFLICVKFMVIISVRPKEWREPIMSLNSLNEYCLP